MDVGSAFLSGPHATSYVSDIAPDSTIMAVHFLPGGAYPFCGVPLHEVADANVGLDDLWGADGRGCSSAYARRRRRTCASRCSSSS